MTTLISSSRMRRPVVDIVVKDNTISLLVRLSSNAIENLNKLVIQKAHPYMHSSIDNAPPHRINTPTFAAHTGIEASR